MVARSKVWICGRLLAGIAGSNLAAGKDVYLDIAVFFCQVEVSATS